MIIELTHFDGYIHLLTAANLAYAGSDRFKAAIDTRLVNIADPIKRLIDKKIERIKLDIAAYRLEENELINNKVTKIETDLKIKVDQIQNVSTIDVAYTNGLKSIFVFTALYCLSLLVLSGFEQFFKSHITLNKSLLILLISFLYNVIIFFRSFFKKYKYHDVSAAYPVVVLLIIITFVFLFAYYFTFLDKYIIDISLKLTFAFSLFIAASPYLLHFLRIIIHKGYHNCKIIHPALEARKELKIVSRHIRDEFLLREM